MSGEEGTQPGERPAAAAVASAFGLTGQVGELRPVGGAWSNRVYRLEVGDAAYAVKQVLNPWGRADWFDRIDEAWAVEQRAILAGVDAPAPVPNPRTGSWRADVEQERGPGSAIVRVHRWVDGTPAPGGPATEPLARWSGATLATIHQLALRPVRPEVFTARDIGSVHRWPEVLTRIDEAGVPWMHLAHRATGAVDQIAELHRAASEGTELMSHRDIDQKNLILRGAGPTLCDWDVAGPIAPRTDVADVALSMARWEQPEIALATVDAYRRAGGELSRITTADLVPMLLNGLDWIELNIDRALGTGTLTDRALGAQLAPQLLDALPAKVAIAQRIDAFLTPDGGRVGEP